MEWVHVMGHGMQSGLFFAIDTMLKKTPTFGTRSRAVVTLDLLG